MTRLMEIMAAVGRERERQDKKYGAVLKEVRSVSYGGPQREMVQGPGGHELGGWLVVIEKELDEAKDALIHGGFQQAAGRNNVRTEILQIMAVCAAALEQHGVSE